MRACRNAKPWPSTSTSCRSTSVRNASAAVRPSTSAIPGTSSQSKRRPSTAAAPTTRRVTGSSVASGRASRLAQARGHVRGELARAAPPALLEAQLAGGHQTRQELLDDERDPSLRARRKAPTSGGGAGVARHDVTIRSTPPSSRGATGSTEYGVADARAPR